MPVHGSFAETVSRQLAAIPLMMEETARESAEAMESLIKDGTPVNTGALRESIHSNPVHKNARGQWVSSVESNLSYAAPVEYGSAPHRIEARNAQALHFNGEFYNNVNHPGHSGAHMFRRGAITFERMEARSIAIRNAKQYLQTS